MAVEETAILNLLTRGGPEAVAELDATSAASMRLAGTTDAIGSAMLRTRKRSFLMNQALFTMRRLMYMGTLAVVGSAIALVDWGVKFNLAMQMGRVILTRFTGSTRLANIELDHLFNLAAYSPFQFQDLVKGAAVMYAFGFTTKQVNRTMADLVDALTATGRATPAALNRVSNALGHMMSMGTATGQVLNQLARDGIPGVYKSIEKYFGLTSAQAHHIGALGLPSSEVLKAIEIGIERSKLHGIARKMQESTLKGVFTTFKDYSSQLIGNFLQKPMDWIQSLGNRINPALHRMQAGFKKGGFSGMWEGLTRGRPTGWEKDLALIGKNLSLLWTILTKSVIPAFRAWFGVLQPFLGILLILAGILSTLAAHSTIFKYAMMLLVAELIRARLAIIALDTVLAVKAMYTWALTVYYAWQGMIYFVRYLVLGEYWIRMLTLAQIAWDAVVALLTPALDILVGTMAGMTIAEQVAMASTVELAAAETGLSIATYATVGAMMALDAAMGVLDFLGLLSPVGWVMLAVVALSFALYELITHWDAVKKWIVSNAPIIAAAITLMFGPLGAAVASVLLLVRYWHQITSFFSGIFGSHAAATGALSNQFNPVHPLLAGNAAPLLQQNPKIPVLSGNGGFVTPAKSNKTVTGDGLIKLDITHTSILEADGKNLATVVAKYKDDTRARR